MDWCFFFFFIEFIRMTYHLYDVLCVHHPVKSPAHHRLCPLHTLPLSSAPHPNNHHTVLRVHELLSLYFFFSAQSLHPLHHPKDWCVLEIWIFLFQRTDRCKEYDLYKHIDFILINLFFSFWLIFTQTNFLTVSLFTKP